MNTDMVLSFDVGQCKPSMPEIEMLQSWVNGWAKLRQRVTVVLGGLSHTPRCGVLRRLHTLFGLLRKFGVRYKLDPADQALNKSNPMGCIDDLPFDCARLYIARSEPE